MPKRLMPVTTDPGARLLEVVSRLGGATSHATPASVFNGPEHWRQRAEEARRMADLMSNIPSKEAMLRIAEDYEHLAEWAEERAKRSA
jgi:hypothetical protein